MAEVALSLSGGGYRAAMFHLGILHYLHNLRYEDGHSFLEDVHTISTISGGTLTGLWYMIHYCKNHDINAAIKELFEKMVTISIADRAVANILQDSVNNTSLIREMVSIYDEVFFENQTFGEILDAVEKGPIHHFCAGGTDFSSGLPFRFQAGRKIPNVPAAYEHGWIGNYSTQISWENAHKIRLSEIMATSSCFPGGFEPIRMPDDFAGLKSEDLNTRVVLPINLMDGGVVDNQGIDALLRANDQMAKAANADCRTFVGHDLIIISDVASERVDDKKTFDMALSKYVSIYGINFFIVLTMLLSCIGMFWGYKINCSCLFGAAAASLFIFMTIWACLVVLEEKIYKCLLKKSPVTFDACQFYSLSLYKIWELLQNRLNSLIHLSMSVFMKPIRQMRYRALYESPLWKHRLITNNVDELSGNGKWSVKNDYPEFLRPSKDMIANSNKASSFGTTLWFDETAKKKKIPEALFTAGQYTICMNLLEYVEKIKAIDASKVTSFQQQILTLEDKLKADWDEFKKNPQCMVINYERGDGN